MNKPETDSPITYCIEEIDNTENVVDFNIEDLIKQIDDEISVPNMINYSKKYNVKEILLICEYYGISKKIKTSTINKETLIDYLIAFENDTANTDIVFRRKNMWFYINELKNDKFMKKFVLWQ